ncbi:cell wall hydrolase [Salibacterium halotolerans]|uniref:N-acetylmuramoyl-L-alanine amidase n=1 Tax=Salibacterium halotolerans TaxID=1884432 RepID=A0A1I5QIC8_9BACI|nr:cell wall hydrolase [Salibacterium halotolerans]SFP45867.1 N-acetylmuramoyl-L-alanine amidase [Salibacterium halotolerans]
MKKVISAGWAVLFFIVFVPQIEAQEDLLQQGEKGPAVTKLQQSLIYMEYLHTNPTGYYGPLTNNAVQKFQSDFGLAVDGKAGENTLQKLDEVNKLARIVHGEARGETFKGQVAVAAVVHNRIQSSEFPGTVEGVITEKNAFTAVQDGQYNLEPDRTAYRAVKEAWNGYDPSKGSHYYYNPVLATSDWIWTRTKNLQIGKHVFAD